MANNLKCNQFFPLPERQRKDRFVVLFNPEQGAYHIELESDYRRHSQNGYVIHIICNSRAESELVLKQMIYEFTPERSWVR